MNQFPVRSNGGSGRGRERFSGASALRWMPGSAAWTASGAPITWGDDVLTVLMGTLPSETLIQRMTDADAIVVMKIGRNIGKIRHALREAGKYDRAWLVEYAAQEGQTVQRLSEAEDRVTPYFSIVLVHGQGRRP